MPQSKTTETFEDMKEKALLLNLISLQKLGIALPANVKSNPLQKMKHYLMIFFSCLVYIPTFIGQMYALYHFWGNLDILVHGLYNMIAIFMCHLLGMYGLIMKDEIANLFVTYKDEVLTKVEKVGFKNSTNEIFSKTSKKAHQISSSAMISLQIFFILWAPVPLATHYLENNDETMSAEDDEKRWLHFCFLIWLPYDIRVAPYYEIMYLTQIIMFYTASCYLCYVSMTMASFIIHVAGQFEILYKAIEDMNLFLKTAEGQKETQMQNTVTMNENIKHFPFASDTIMEDFENVDSTLHYLSTKGNADHLEIILDSQEHREYFLNIIKLHQAILQFADEVKKIAGPVIFLILFTCQFLGCLMIFLMTLEWKLGSRKGENFARFGIAGICALFYSYIFCSNGDIATQNCRKVASALYENRWYHYTTKFNRDLLMALRCAQKDIYFSGANIYKLSLETYGQMLNTMYTLYTLLQKAYEG